MKKFVLIMLCVLPFAGNAQGFLKKLKDKAVEAASSTLVNKSQQIAEKKIDNMADKTTPATTSPSVQSPEQFGADGADAAKMANGLPDLRNKLLNEGRYAAGDLFETNKSAIKSQSYGVLNEIGILLTYNPGIKLLIIGYGDSNSDRQNNKELRLQRAKAAKDFIIKLYGINEGRLQINGTDGSQQAGNEQNRQVEFVKL